MAGYTGTKLGATLHGIARRVAYQVDPDFRAPFKKAAGLLHVTHIWLNVKNQVLKKSS